ncbi:uncharacterized protein LOC112049465 [Bicyclus anynana]|uniref:Uncharacterized protein LOC112049465 n=1 Tax=Bicyclus anynana TaxID=110368 RepID=A0A6J1NDL9_BICAN|nr:uncharacterized protein LOC112049465 [Bicyclus anynana]
MFREVFTIMGYCCQFDTTYFRKHSGQLITNFNTGIEISEALEVVVNSQKMFANGSTTDSFVFLYVFDKQNNLTLLDSSITLTPSTYFDVTVSVWAIDSSEEVKSLSLMSRKCFLPTDTKIASNSYQVCMTVSMMRKVVVHCRCLPFNYKFEEFDVEEYPICTWERLQCIYQTLNRVQSDIRDVISQCYQKCDYVQYETEAEYVKVDRHIAAAARGDCRVAVHFADNTCIKYRREVLYTWDQMLANLGGIFGLCLGGSIISIIELAWFILELLFTIARGQRVAHNVHGDKKRMVFTLTNKIASLEKAKTQKHNGMGIIKSRKRKSGRFPYLN